MEVQFDFRIFEMCKTTYIIFHRFTICQKALAKQRYQCPYRIISMFRHSQFLSTKRFQKPCLQPWNEWRSVAIKIPPPFMSNFNYWISEYKPLWNIVKKKTGNRSIEFPPRFYRGTYEHRVHEKISLRKRDMFAAFLSPRLRQPIGWNMIARGNVADNFETGNAAISIFSGSFFLFF